MTWSCSVAFQEGSLRNRVVVAIMESLSNQDVLSRMFDWDVARLFGAFW